MKIKSLLILIIGSYFFVNLFSSISNNKIFTELKKDALVLNKENISQEFRSISETQRIEKDLQDEDVKYIYINKPLLNYAATAFYGADYFYLGATDVNAQDYSLMRAKINQGATVSQNTVEFVALSPQQVYLNGIKENENLVKRDNPIYNKRILDLTLQGRNPILTLQDATDVNGVNFGIQKVVCLVDFPNDGSSVKTNEIEINDANNNPTDGVVGLAASTDKIFAAVKSQAGSFGDGDGGFAVLISKDSKLKPIDAVAGNENANLAVKLDLTADILFAMTQDASNGVDFGDMYWDANLQRLFIGLIDAGRSNAVNNGGAVSVLVGRLDGNQLIIESVINLNQALFSLNQKTDIVGFYFNAIGNILSSAYKLRTMKTSTNKNYLIVNGATGLVATDDWKNRVYALPVVGALQSDGTNTLVANIGKVADKNNINHDVVVANNAGMTLRDDIAAKVGAGALPIPNNIGAEDMFVVNDSVFVSVAQDRFDATHEAGIFRSTALFDQNGNIRAWTPWQRVAGTIDKVYGSGFDMNSGNFWYFTESAGVKNTVKVTQWGKSLSYTGLMGNGLVDLLADEFIQNNAGVHQVFNFDEKTPSIARTGVADEVSFMAGLGYKKIALVQTGAATAGPIFTPTQAQYVKDTNVFVIQDEALSDLGPICCTDISRGLGAANGWLFVGGYNGVAVWRESGNAGTAGNGWDGQVGSGAVDFSVLIAAPNNFSFKEIGDFSQVRKLVAKAGFLYIMSLDSINRFTMVANKFDDAVTAPLNVKTITPPPGYLLDMIVFYRAGGDTRLLVATTQGLFYSNAINDVDADKTGVNAPIWTQVALTSGTGLSSPVTHLSFLDVQKGGYSTNGNLYALAADLSLNLATVYRFDVQNGIINPIKENSGTDYFYSVGELRTNFLTDGALGYTTLSKHFGTTDFLRKIWMIDSQSSIRRLESAINLDLESSAYNVGVMVQNTASGAWVVPGDWGIRVNE
ncbi:MAG: hypothetical protein ABIF12_00320 [bacterium]